MGVRRPGLVVAAAILVSLPMIPSFLDGGISVAAVTLRFGIAVALCWAGGAVIERVYDGYARKAREAEIEKALLDGYGRFAQERHGQEGPPTSGSRTHGGTTEQRNGSTPPTGNR